MIFPFIDPSEFLSDENIIRETPLAVEWAWDFDKNKFLLDRGKMYKVYRNEAIKIWIWKILVTPRYRHLIYDHDYGNELDSLVGRSMSKELAKSEGERIIKESLLTILADYIKKVDDFEIEMKDDLCVIYFNVETIYGEVNFDGMAYRIR